MATTRARSAVESFQRRQIASAMSLPTYSCLKKLYSPGAPSRGWRARGGDLAKAVGRRRDRGERRGLDVEAELRGEAQGAHGTQAVLAEARYRIAHGPNGPPREIPLPAERIGQRARERLERDGVHR